MTKLVGTKFQLKVWNYLKRIPKEKQKLIKRFNAIKSPYPIVQWLTQYLNPITIIPCHRVIRSDGTLGGYSGKGGDKKKLLLKNEGIIT